MIKKRFFRGFIILISTLIVVSALVTSSAAGVDIIDAELSSEPVTINQGVVKGSWRKTCRIGDFKHKTLVVDFTSPQDILSTLEGFKTGVTTVANHYLPPPSWNMSHDRDLGSFTSRILETVGRAPASSALLMTGADMDNLTITDKQYKGMRATALVTAGVSSNAQRASRSTGFFYEPGTINIILITNMELTPRAMARAVISITEGKSAALADLDIRSSDDPLNLQATGTGTDNIIVVKGQGRPLDSVGGHTKMGELMAKAVYDGVKQAIFLQNGILPGRNIFQRLDERNISIHALAQSSDCQWDKTQTSKIAAKLEVLLLQPEYAGLVEQAFALCDARERGLLNDLSAFSATVNAAARKIAKRPVERITAFKATSFLPEPLEMVFNALMSGIFLGLE
ncbi:MAG: adenosylcobinamide amidohydrolase [Desulfobacterium sp.]|jgi:adenosylcobinamide amidohydrolase|nr:adenosylcobinamide amidohydrolase [Desulfobacterium sp.]